MPPTPFSALVFLLACAFPFQAHAGSGNSTIMPVAHMAFFSAMFPTTPVPPSLFLPNLLATQTQEAFLMSLADLDVNPDILPETALKYLIQPVPPSGVTATSLAVANMTRHAFNGEGVDMTIGAKFDASSQALSPVLQSEDVIQVGYNPGSLQSHSNIYTTFLRIVPPGAYDGTFIAQNIQNQFGWNRVSVFSVSDDTDSVDALMEFTYEAAISGLNIVANEMFPLAATDISSNIDHAAQFDPRVIILFMPPQCSVMFIKQACQMGLVKEGVTVIGTSYSAAPTLLTYFNQTDDVASMMKGFLIFQANLNWTTTTMGAAYVQRYRSWPATIFHVNGTTTCNNATDDQGYYTINGQHLNYNASLPFICGGIIPSSYTPTNLSNGTGYVYDALQALARGLDIMVRNATSPITKVSGTALKRIMVDYVRFEGVTGTVSFSKGRTSSGSYGYGDRVDRIPYMVTNFNIASYSSEQNPFRTIGYYDADMVYTACDPANDGTCSYPIYNSLDNTLPSDSPAPVFVGLSTGISNAIIILASIFMLLTALCMIFMAYYRNDSSLKALQPLLLLGTLLGCMMCGAEMILEALPIDTTSCAAHVWIVHLSFYLILGSIMAKIYRIHLIINANGLKKVVVSEKLAFCIFLGGLGFFLIYLVILATVGNSTPAEIFTVSTYGLRTYQTFCKMKQPGVSLALYIVEAIMILAAVGVNTAISKAPKKIHESAVELRVIVGVAVFYVTAVIREAGLGSDYSVLRVVIAFAFFFAMFVILVTRIPQMLPRYFGANKGIGRHFSDSRRNGSSYSRQKESGLNSFYLKPEDVLGNILTKYNSLTKEMQVAMCIKHIELWKQLLIDAEIPVREETSECQIKKPSSAGVAHFASASARNPLGSPSGAARGSASNNFGSARAFKIADK